MSRVSARRWVRRIPQLLAAAALSLAAACGGGGGPDGTTMPSSPVSPVSPSVDLTASTTTVQPQASVTLSWTSENTSSCTATGAWSGTRATSGSESVTVAAAGTYGLQCTGSAGGTASDSVALQVANTFVLTVQVRYQAPGPPIVPGGGGQRVPDWGNPVTAGVPHVFVELLDADTQAVLASGNADANGNIAFSNLDPQKGYRPRALSKILASSPTLDFMVVNNTQPVDTSASSFRTRYKPYELAAPQPYRPAGSTAPYTLTLTAQTGWNGTTLVDAQRAGGLFGLLANAVREARSFATTTGSANWRTLTILWSTRNRGGLASGNPNFDDGVISGSGGYYSSGHGRLETSGEERGGGSPVFEDFIFLSGDQDFELHELYPFVSNHEMGHFVQAQFSRLVGPAGAHRASDFQDFRLAYVEGTANAIALLVAESPIVTRSQRINNQVVAFVDDWSTGRSNWPVGWYQETTVARAFWKLFDPAGTTKLSRDAVLAPMVEPQFRTGAYLPSLWAHVWLLKQLNPTVAPGIDNIVDALNTVSTGNDVWGSAETHAGNRIATEVLPPYVDMAAGQNTLVCTGGDPKDFNRVGNRRLIRVQSNVPRTVSIVGPASTDGVITAYNTAACGGTSNPTGKCREFNSSRTATESATLSWPGTTIVEIGDCAVAFSQTDSEVQSCGASAPPVQQCWNVTVN